MHQFLKLTASNGEPTYLNPDTILRVTHDPANDAVFVYQPGTSFRLTGTMGAQLLAWMDAYSMSEPDWLHEPAQTLHRLQAAIALDDALEATK